MKFQYFAVVAVLAGVASAAEPTTTTSGSPSVITPVPPPGVICPMVVCAPITLSARAVDPVCPTHCEKTCKIIDDVCCPGSKKAVCESSSVSVPNATALTSGTAAPSGSSTAVSGPVSSITSLVPPRPVGSITPAAASPTSGANTLTIVSSCMLVTLIAIGLNI
ncbi:hypothetical protein INT47_011258 [Mucor saturninus]|uniref:Uncharacterized protein n=1 Tax=Mucor saturninus TaxID=64648 RepID=A0A8H7RLF1_9FUNG|nr:hypothetical protein INT47_011258 [Mucor saturninus]